MKIKYQIREEYLLPLTNINACIGKEVCAKPGWRFGDQGKGKRGYIKKYENGNPWDIYVEWDNDNGACYLYSDLLTTNKIRYGKK